MSRAWRLGTIVAVVGVAAGLAVMPVEGWAPAELEVIDSKASGAAIGLISRMPAESAGGLLSTATAITLDKATAKAAGFTSGELAEGFLASSWEQYRNPTLITAQYPPTPAFPAEAQGGTDAGVATLHAAATDRPSATAEAEGVRAGDAATLAVRHGTSLSHSELGPDGVATRAVAAASGISIGGVVTIASATTEAVTMVPTRGRPVSTLKVTVTGLLVGGVPAELTDQGLQISDRIPVGPGELAAFNAATAQLAALGVTVAAAPIVRETGAERARAEGGAVAVRYKVADQLGGDEEVIIAQVQSRSTLLLAESQPFPPVTELPGSPIPPAEAGPAAMGASAADGSSRPGPVAAEEGGSVPLAIPGTGRPVPSGSAAVTQADNGPPGAFPESDSASERAGATSGALNLGDPPFDPAVARLRAGYGFILLLAAAGAAAHLATARTRSR
jgi:hypothetical protein